MWKFLLGVASSVTATAVAWAFAHYFLPLLQAWRSSTESIAGSWFIFDAATGREEGVLRIRQFGTRAAGRLHLKRTARDYLYSGVYLSQQLLLTFREEERGTWIIGAFLLRHRADGTMVGRTLFWHHDEGEFHCNSYNARRESCVTATASPRA